MDNKPWVSRWAAGFVDWPGVKNVTPGVKPRWEERLRATHDARASLLAEQATIAGKTAKINAWSALGCFALAAWEPLSRVAFIIGTVCAILAFVQWRAVLQLRLDSRGATLDEENK